MQKILYIFLFIFVSIMCYSQNPVYFKIGEKEFANSDIFTLLFDESNEVLYVGTNNGLYAYKQNKFIKIKKPIAQKGAAIFGLKQNSKGVIFCHNLNGQLFTVTNDSLNVIYQAPLDENISTLYYFFIENDDIVIGNSQRIKLINQIGDIKEVIIDEKYFQGSNSSKGISAMSQTIDQTIYIVFTGREEVAIYKDGQLDIRNFEFKNIEATTKFFTLQDRLLSVCKGGNINSSSPFVHQNYTPENKEQVHQFSAEELIGLNQKKGIHFLKHKNDTLFESQHFFDQIFISSYCKKDNGLLFFGTFNDGIYVVPNRDIIRPTYPYLFQGIAVSQDGEVYISSRDGTVFKYGNELNIVGSEDLNIDNIFTYYGAFKFDDIEEKGIIYSTKNNFNYALKDIVQINENIIIEATRDKILISTSDSMVDLNNLSYIKKNIKKDRYSIFVGKRCAATTWNANDSLIYFATGFGVFSREWSTPKIDHLLFEGKTFVGNDLEFHNNQLIIATEEKGVLIYENKRFSFQLSIKNGLKSNAVDKIKTKKNLLYILTQEGLQIYDLKQNHLIELGIQEGNFRNDIINFDVSEDKLWLLQKHSFHSYNLHDFGHIYDVANLYIDSIIIDNTVLKTVGNNKFNYDQNALFIYYDYRNIETKQETIIEYTLEGFYSEWKTAATSENEISFEYLPPGKYNFKIRASYKGHLTKTKTYSFVIKPPFWQTWWFILSLITSLIGIITFYYKRRIKKIKKQENARHEKQALLTATIDAKLKALRSQMNPHFIFNSLNSIQAFILKQDTEKSYDYVVMFSDLVRKTLQYSDVDYINIDDELSFLKNYLSLESLRMKNEFQYSISYKGDKGIQIPSLMVQPFIENAIHHGLLHRLGLKTLDISFKFGKEMTCTIIDNGVGRAKAKAIRERQNARHKSFSLDATKQRMNMLNKQNGDQASYEIIDLYKDGEPCGTKVIMTLPFIFEY